MGNGVIIHEWLWGWLLGKNDASDDACQGLTDYELITSFRNSNISTKCQFRDDLIRQAKTMEFVQRVESDAPDLKFREEPPLYFRATDRQLPIE